MYLYYFYISIPICLFTDLSPSLSLAIYIYIHTWQCGSMDAGVASEAPSEQPQETTELQPLGLHRVLLGYALWGLRFPQKGFLQRDIDTGIDI